MYDFQVLDGTIEPPDEPDWRPLLVDEAGNTYDSLDRDRYRRMRHSDAIEQVFTPSWLLSHATDQERDGLVQALADAWDCGDGDEAAGPHILPASPASPFRWLP